VAIETHLSIIIHETDTDKVLLPPHHTNYVITQNSLNSKKVVRWALYFIKTVYPL